MPILNLLLTFALARAAQLEKRELLATFDDLADAGEDLGDARSIGPYNGLDFPIDWALFTTGENATSTGGVELKSLTQMAANVFQARSYDLAVRTSASQGFTPDHFDFHSFSWGCAVVAARSASEEKREDSAWMQVRKGTSA